MKKGFTVNVDYNNHNLFCVGLFDTSSADIEDNLDIKAVFLSGTKIEFQFSFQGVERFKLIDLIVKQIIKKWFTE